MVVKCPAEGCAQPFEKVVHAASHMAKSTDSEHPWDSYAEAERRLKSGVSEEPIDPEPTPDPEGDRGTGGTGGSDVPVETEGANPIFDNPPWGRDRDDLCPDCQQRMDRLAEGQQVSIETENGLVTDAEADGDDRICYECDVIVTAEGNRLNYVN